MTSLSARAPKRLLAAATTLAALVAASLLGAAPAEAADADTITGKVTAPSGVEVDLDDVVVLAWVPGARGFDIASAGDVASDGTFRVWDLAPGGPYQLSVLDTSGVLATSYYAGTGKVTGLSSGAKTVAPGATNIRISPVASAPVTNVRVVAPAGVAPSWWEDTLGIYVIEPGTGRLSGFTPGSGLSAQPGQPLSAPAGLDAPRTAVPAAGGTDVLRLPTSGLFPGVGYALALVQDGSDASLSRSYYYGGAKRAVTSSLADAGSFVAGNAVDVYLLGATAKTAPTISGTAQVGKKLTAEAGTFSMAGKVSYQWLRNGKAISGATSSTYTLRGADHGAKVSVRTTLSPTAAGYGQAVKSSAQTAKVKAGAAPKATALPKITGTAKVGKKLTASRGTWSLTGLSYSYRWLRDGKEITGATKSTYVLTKSDAGTKISVRVTAKKTGYTSGTARSASTATVAR